MFKPVESLFWKIVFPLFLFKWERRKMKASKLFLDSKHWARHCLHTVAYLNLITNLSGCNDYVYLPEK